MIRRILNKKKVRNANFFIEPDEIFLDSENLPNFDHQQFEGRIEKPISKKTLILVGAFFFIFIVVFYFRLGYLQIQKGEAYLNRSQNNVLEKQIIFSDRGIIYDRNKIELAWNKKTDDLPTPLRAYLTDGFAHLLGYVSYPMQDKLGNYWQSDFIGKDGLEKEYNDKLKGENGSKIVETDVYNKVYSENVVNAPKRGADLITTIDSRIQKKIFSLIKNFSEKNYFSGGSGIIMDVRNGELLVSTSYPEYDSEALSLGKDSKKIETYLTDKRKVFLDRNISGLYTPGSIVKPFLALGALNEGVIDPLKKILSTGSISIPNPYFPNQKSVFKDWRSQGFVDMRDAIAVSSDVYFYEIGGGYGDQKGLGILNIEKYAKLFGFGQKTGVDLPDEKEGVIPSPEWKAKNFKNDPWRIGDTYYTAIGQYGFQVTPIEMVRAVSAIANNGTLLTPHFVLEDSEKEKEVKKIDLKKDYFDVIHEGMRKSTISGTSAIINVPYVKVASKTGTAQVGLSKKRVNSWVTGFFPYDSPKYAFVIMMESGPSSNRIGASSIMRELLDWMYENTPEYLQ